MSRPIETWDIETVAKWLNSIGLNSLEIDFRKQKVNGNMLVTLTMEDLTGDEFKCSTFQAKRLLEQIKAKQKLPTPSSPVAAPAPQPVPQNQSGMLGFMGGAAVGAVVSAVKAAVCKAECFNLR